MTDRPRPHGAARHPPSTKTILAKLSGEFAIGGRASSRPRSSKWPAASFNIGSPKQLGDILFGRMGLPGARKTATGAWSTAAGVLEDLAERGQPVRRQGAGMATDHQAEEQLLRRPARPTRTREDRVHTSYHAGSDDDGPSVVHRTEPAEYPGAKRGGAQDPHGFRGDTGARVLVSADYSQIELRLLAHMADIPQLKEAFSHRPRHPRDDGVGDVRGADGER